MKKRILTLSKQLYRVVHSAWRTCLPAGKVAFLVLLAGPGHAQETDSLKRDTTREWKYEKRFDLDLSEDSKPEEEDKFKFDFGIFKGLDIGFGALMDNGSLNMSEENQEFDHRLVKSNNVQIRFLNANFKYGVASLNVALALDDNSWDLKQPVTMQPNEEEVRFVEESFEMKKNKFKTTYLAFPVNLRIHARNDFKVAVGWEPGFLLNGRVKQKSSEEGKTKVKDDYNLRNFRYAISGRIGYKSFTLFVRYYPQSIFADNRGPDLQSIGFGLGWGI